MGGCGSNAPSGRIATEADLRGRAFVAIEAAHRSFVKGVDITIGFSDGSGATPASLMGSDAGCNATSGSYSIAAGRLQRESYRSPRVGCSAELEGQDDWLNGFIADGPEARVSDGGQRLELKTADDTVTFRVRPNAAAKSTPAE
jgi:META domain